MQDFINYDELERVIDIASSASDWNALEKALHVRNATDCIGLKLAIEKLEANKSTSIRFYTDVLPFIVDAASNKACVAELKLSILLQSSETANSITAEQCLHVLACSFFLCTRRLKGAVNQASHEFPDAIDWRIILNDHGVGCERLQAFLAYFYAYKLSPDPNRILRFERKKVPNYATLEFWTENEQLVKCDAVEVHNGTMEDVEHQVFLNFANRDLCIGTIIPSATQEEILFSMAPEYFIGMLFSQRLADNEILVVKNLRRYCKYTGYLYSFKFSSIHDPFVFDSCQLDAVFSSHFSSQSIVRDLNKAFACFAQFPNSVISTGQWGCGAFGGDKVAKFLQQLLAVSLTESHLCYSAFRDTDLMSKVSNVLKFAHGKSVGFLAKVLLSFQEHGNGKSFYDYLLLQNDASKLSIPDLEALSEKQRRAQEILREAIDMESRGYASSASELYRKGIVGCQLQ